MENKPKTMKTTEAFSRPSATSADLASEPSAEPFDPQQITIRIYHNMDMILKLQVDSPFSERPLVYMWGCWL